MHTRTHIVTRLIGLCILLMATTRGLAQQEPPATGDEAALLAVLQSDAPIFNRAKACQQLAVVGTKTSVPVLAKLLSDEQMSHYARVALEPLADPSVDEALRASTGTLKGGLLVGVINTIGMRRDTGATGRLKELLGDTDPQVAAAAAAALGRLASSKSMEILQSSLASDAPLKFAVADACLTAADTLLTHGKRAEATRLYDALRQAELPKYLQIAALSGAIRARGPDGVDLLVAQLKSADEDFFGVGLSMAHLVPGDRVTQALLEELSKPLPEPTEKVKILVINKAEYGAQDKWVDVTSQVSAAVQGNGISIRAGNQIAGDPISNVVKSLKVSYTLDDEPKTVEVPEGGVLDIAGHIPSNPRQATVIAVLGKRGDKAALPAVLSAAKDAPWDVRLPAIRALARIGDATAVPLLLETASSAQGALSDAALDSLADLPDQATDERIAAMLADSRGQQRLVVIELLGRREISSSVPALLDLVGSDDPATRKAVVASLGLTVGLEDLGALLQQLVKPVSAEDAAAVKAALQTASLRMPDRDAAAQLFLDRMKSAPMQSKEDLLDLLGVVGGKKALDGVVSAARAEDEQIQDAATRVLGRWMSADAAPALLELARSGNDKFKVRTLRGYIRIARQLNVPTEERVTMCATALDLADRDEERNLVLETLGRYPTVQSLAIASSCLDKPGLNQTASSSAVAIAEKLVDDQPAEVAKVMKQVLKATNDPDLTKRARQSLNRTERK